MRKIKFRGKKIHGNEWLYGYYFAYESAGNGKVYHSIVPEKYSSKPSDYFHVIPDTVSQFTGLTDKNGTEIYEGDVVQYEKVRIDWSKTIRTIEKFEIEYNDCANYNQYEASKLEIIGNIHDNPSLLTKK